MEAAEVEVLEAHTVRLLQLLALPAAFSTPKLMLDENLTPYSGPRHPSSGIRLGHR